MAARVLAASGPRPRLGGGSGWSGRRERSAPRNGGGSGAAAVVTAGGSISHGARGTDLGAGRFSGSGPSVAGPSATRPVTAVRRRCRPVPTGAGAPAPMSWGITQLSSTTGISSSSRMITPNGSRTIAVVPP